MKKSTRRTFLKQGAATVGVLTAASVLSEIVPAQASGDARGISTSSEKAKVYFTKDISPESMLKLYKLVNQSITGKVAVKIHTGQPIAPYILSTDMVKAVTDSIPGCTIVETNMFNPGNPREKTESHKKVIAANGWTFTPIDILDEDGSVYLPVPGGKWFKEIAMGSHIKNYDSVVVLTHFKGHPIGGFGGSLKNIAIGFASGAEGKKQMHQRGEDIYGVVGEQFMEHMAESGKAIIEYFGPRITYVNVLNNMSVDCDCVGGDAEPPTVPDLGIMASTDILAIDQASIDMVYALPKEVNKHLVERIESRKGLHQLTAMERLGMGNRNYEIINV